MWLLGFKWSEHLPWWHQRIRKRGRDLLGSVSDQAEGRAPGNLGKYLAEEAWFGWSTLQLLCLS